MIGAVGLNPNLYAAKSRNKESFSLGKTETAKDTENAYTKKTN